MKRFRKFLSLEYKSLLELYSKVSLSGKDSNLYFYFHKQINNQLCHADINVKLNYKIENLIRL